MTMTAKTLKEFAALYAKGFRPYQGEILRDVYERLRCRNPERAYWVEQWPILHCFGCGQRCTPKTPEGFQVVLPTVDAGQRTKFDITPAQMVAAKAFLRAEEAAYCLNVSPRQVYSLAYEGKLVRHVDKPFRVTAESVIGEMKRIDW
jgi:hypothetical protein